MPSEKMARIMTQWLFKENIQPDPDGNKDKVGVDGHVYLILQSKAPSRTLFFFNVDFGIEKQYLI